MESVLHTGGTLLRRIGVDHTKHHTKRERRTALDCHHLAGQAQADHRG